MFYFLGRIHTTSV